MIHEKGLNYYYEGVWIITWTTWNKCKISSKGSEVRHKYYWMPQLEVHSNLDRRRGKIVSWECCLNEYRSNSERGVKVEMTRTLKGVLTLDTHIVLLAQIELLNKRLAESNLNQVNISHVKTLKCDFCVEGRANGLCVLERSSEEA